MEALDDLLNDLNAVTRELGLENPSEPASSTSVTSETSASAESGFGSHDIHDFHTIKKVGAPPPTALHGKDGGYSEDIFQNGLDDILNTLNSMSSDMMAKKEVPSTPEMVHLPVKSTLTQVQTAKRVSFRQSDTAVSDELTPPKPSPPKAQPQLQPPMQPSPQKPAVRPRQQQMMPPPPRLALAPIVTDKMSTLVADKVPPPLSLPLAPTVDDKMFTIMTEKMPPPPPKFPPPALTPPLQSATVVGQTRQQPRPVVVVHETLTTRGYTNPNRNMQQPMNPDVNNFMEKIKAAEHVRIFSGEGSYKLIPVEKNMCARYLTQLMAEKHRVRLTPKHSLLEYNPELATERILEEHENVCQVISQWDQTPCELHFIERKDKWLLFSNPQVILDRKFAIGQPSREERHSILQRWFPESGGFRYPGFDGKFVRDTIFYKNDTKDKWTKKYIELRQSKLLIFKKESGRERAPEEIVDLNGVLLFRGVEWKAKFKAPLANGFAIRHPTVTKMNKSQNPDGRIRFFAVEDQLDELKWITALRLAKLGMRMIENYRNTISTVERPSSLLSLRPPSFGPLPVSNSRPNSLETLQVDGPQPSPKRATQPMRPPSVGFAHHPPPGPLTPRRIPIKMTAPMTNYYDPGKGSEHQQPIIPMRRGDFPPPPPFVSQIKALSTQVYEQGPQQNQIGFDLPPPPPELMVQAARSSKMNGIVPLPTTPRSARPPPPRRNPNTRLHQ